MDKCREQHAYVELSTAFDSAHKEILRSILQRCSCPLRFMELMREIHDGTIVKVRYGGELLEPFEVSRGVKVHLSCQTDRNLFDPKKLKAKTKLSKSNLLELQDAIECAVVADSADGLQRVLTRKRKELGFQINTQKIYHVASERFLPTLH